MQDIAAMLQALFSGNQQGGNTSVSPVRAPMDGSILPPQEMGGNTSVSPVRSPYSGIFDNNPTNSVSPAAFATPAENTSRLDLNKNVLADVNKQAVSPVQNIRHPFQGISMLANKASASGRLQELFDQMRNTNQLNSVQEQNRFAPAFGRGQVIPPQAQQPNAWGTTVIPEPPQGYN
jgi:hypothetical protein